MIDDGKVTRASEEEGTEMIQGSRKEKGKRKRSERKIDRKKEDESVENKECWGAEEGLRGRGRGGGGRRQREKEGEWKKMNRTN